MRIVKKYWLPLLALVLAIGLAAWRIGYLERTNTSLSIEIGSREALQNGEPITLENPVILYKNEPYIPLYEVVERLGGTTDGKTYTLHGSPDARDETMVDLLRVTIENGIVTEIFMGRYE